MPTYRYRCKSCAHEFDQFQKFAEDPLTICPECGQAIRRVIQPVGVVFKGSGWYINDSRPAASASASESQAAEAKPAGEKAESKTEAKSDAKPESKPEPKAEPKVAAPV
jgi:putative FmdB family regulatory protein